MLQLTLQFSGGGVFMLHRLRSFLREDLGFDNAEYALIAAFAAILLFTSQQKLGNKIKKEYKGIGNTISKLR